MTKTKVVHVNSPEWRNTPEAERVYIGRRVLRGKNQFPLSLWGNPYSVKSYEKRQSHDKAVALAISNYEKYMRSRLRADRQLRISLLNLQGKVLGCWCKPEACHGDTLAQLADMSDDEFKDWVSAEPAAHHALTGE